MKVAQAISRALVSEGVTLAAGIAGQSIWRMPLFVEWIDSLHRFAQHLEVANNCVLECA